MTMNEKQQKAARAEVTRLTRLANRATGQDRKALMDQAREHENFLRRAR